MCLRAVETIDHLAARSRWTVVFSVCGVSWVMPRSVCEMLHAWRGEGSKGTEEPRGLGAAAT